MSPFVMLRPVYSPAQRMCSMLATALLVHGNEGVAHAGMRREVILSCLSVFLSFLGLVVRAFGSCELGVLSIRFFLLHIQQHHSGTGSRSVARRATVRNSSSAASQAACSHLSRISVVTKSLRQALQRCRLASPRSGSGGGPAAARGRSRCCWRAAACWQLRARLACPLWSARCWAAPWRWT